MDAFDSNDCWVLFSIGFDKKGSNLKDIIANADRINHAIIMREELETSLNKLVNNDFVFVVNKTYFATNKAIDFYRKNKKFMEGFIEEWLRISDVLKIQSFNIITKNEIKISDEEYEKALNEYNHYFDKLEKTSFLSFLFGHKN